MMIDNIISNILPPSFSTIPSVLKKKNILPLFLAFIVVIRAIELITYEYSLEYDQPAFYINIPPVKRKVYTSDEIFTDHKDKEMNQKESNVGGTTTSSGVKENKPNLRSPQTDDLVTATKSKTDIPPSPQVESKPNLVGRQHADPKISGGTTPQTTISAAAAADSTGTGTPPQTAQTETVVSSVNHDNAPDEAEATTVTIYTRERRDRAGAGIHEMLLAEAYAFHNNVTYGGVCDTGREIVLKEDRESQIELIQGLGLGQVLKFACPSSLDPLPPNTKIVHRSQIGGDHNFKEIWNEEWQKHIQSKVGVLFPSDSNKDPNVLEIAVHMRRGDVTPCDVSDVIYGRYQTNAHYLKLIDEYGIPKDNTTQYHVTIYSEAGSHESYDVFKERGYTLKLSNTTSLVETWQGIMQADVFIMSRSSFSYVPAALNSKGKIYYTNMWHDKLNNWIPVSQQIENFGRHDFLKLKKRCNYTTDLLATKAQYK